MRHLLTIILLVVATFAMGQQSRGDKLYAEGIGLQKVQTVASQKSAKQKFQQAKIAFTTAAKKAQCDTQIEICDKNIKRIQAKKKEESEAAKKPETPADAGPEAKPEEAPKVEVMLSLSVSRLDFKYKPKANQTVKVDCNRDDWEIASCPEWLKVYTAAREFSVIPEENTGDDRSGILTVRCGDKEASLVINQDKIKGLKKLVKDIKGK